MTNGNENEKLLSAIQAEFKQLEQQDWNNEKFLDFWRRLDRIKVKVDEYEFWRLTHMSDIMSDLLTSDCSAETLEQNLPVPALQHLYVKYRLAAVQFTLEGKSLRELHNKWL